MTYIFSTKTYKTLECHYWMLIGFSTENNWISTYVQEEFKEVSPKMILCEEC